MAGVPLGNADIVALRKPGNLPGPDPLASCRNRQPAAKRHRVTGIQRKVEQSQFELVGIDLDRRYGVSNSVSISISARASAAASRPCCRPARGSDTARFQLLPPRESEQALGQCRAALGALDRAVDQALKPGVLRNLFPKQFEIAENRHQQIVEVVRDAAGELAQSFELLHLVHLRQRGLALAGAFFDPLLQFPVGPFQLRRALSDPVLELGVELLELPGLAVELGEHPDLGAQQIRDDRHRHVIDGARRHSRARRSRSVTWMAETKMIAVVETADARGSSPPARSRRARACRRRQDDRDVVLQQLLQRLAGRGGLDQVLAKLAAGSPRS